jgi:hypothetical protein
LIRFHNAFVFFVFLNFFQVRVTLPFAAAFAFTEEGFLDILMSSATLKLMMNG